jgi:hypothetical protein
MEFKVPWEKVQPPSIATSPSLVSRGWADDSQGHSVQTEVGNEHQAQSDAELAHQQDQSSNNKSSPPVLDNRLATTFKVVYRRRSRLVKRRGSIAILRSQHEYQRKAITAFTQRVSNAVEVLLSHSSVEISSSTALNELQEALLESKKLHGLFEETEYKLQQAARKLNVKESELSERERKVYKMVSRIAGITDDDLDPESSWSTSSISTAKTDPHARQYYDRAGQVKILRDNIHNFEVEFQRELTSRQDQRNSGFTASIPDRLFQERFDSKLATLREELEGAKKDAFLFKLACQRQGVTLIDDSEPEDDQDVIDATFEADTHMRPSSIGQRSGRERTLLLRELDTGHKDSTTKIDRWLKAVPPEGQIIQTVVPMVRSNDSMGIDGIENGVGIGFSETVMTPSANTEIAAPIEQRVTASFLADEKRRASSWRELATSNDEAISDGSDGPPSPFDHEFSSADFDGDSPMRRFSDQNTTRPFSLQPVGLGNLYFVSRERRKPRSGRKSH